MENKELEMNELESVSGGTTEQTKEIVDLYNKYNPDNPSRGFSPVVERWLWDVMGCSYDGPERPTAHIGKYMNQYIVPGSGLMNHKEFIKILNRKITERYG